jgi:amino acid transporter
MAWALMLALGISAIIYLGVQVVAVGTVTGLASSQRPLADAGRSFLGPIAGAAVSLLACVSIIGNLSNISIVCPRLTYAFSERHDFPELFGRLHPRFGTPVISIIFFAVIASILAISGTFIWLAAVSVIARLVNYLATCLAALILRKQAPEKSKGGLLVRRVAPILGVGLCLWLGMQSSGRDIVAFVIAAAVGALLYLAGRLATAKKSVEVIS